MTKDPTLEEALNGFLHHRTPGSIVFFVEVGIRLLEFFPVVFQTLVEGAVLGMTRPVGASEGNALPKTLGGANLRGSNTITTYYALSQPGEGRSRSLYPPFQVCEMLKYGNPVSAPCVLLSSQSIGGS